MASTRLAACWMCGRATDLACSDCQIDHGRVVYVCELRECRDGHETACPAEIVPPTLAPVMTPVQTTLHVEGSHVGSGCDPRPEDATR